MTLLLQSHHGIESSLAWSLLDHMKIFLFGSSNQNVHNGELFLVVCTDFWSAFQLGSYVDFKNHSRDSLTHFLERRHGFKSMGSKAHRLPKSLKPMDVFFEKWMRSFLIFYIKRASSTSLFHSTFKSSHLKREKRVKELGLKAW